MEHSDKQKRTTRSKSPDTKSKPTTTQTDSVKAADSMDIDKENDIKPAALKDPQFTAQNTSSQYTQITDKERDGQMTVVRANQRKT